MRPPQISLGNLEELKNFLLENMAPNSPMFVGICGFAGAGKTTLCRMLSVALPGSVTHFECDRFSRHGFSEREKRIAAYQRRDSPGDDEENPVHWYDWDAVQEALDALRHQSRFRYCRAWNPQSGQLDATYSLKLSEDKPSLVLCDGIFLLHSPVKDWFERIICVDCPQPVRQARGTIRTRDPARQAYMTKLEQMYVEPYFHTFSGRADLIYSAPQTP